MYEFLKKVPLFANLQDPDLERLCEMLETVELKDGEQLFAEGEVGNQAFIIQEGQLEIVKASGTRSILLAVRQPGEVIGELALLENRPRMASVQARGDSVLLAIHKDQLDELLNTSSSAARAMFYTVLSRWRNTEAQLRQSEKMAQLGTLTAGVAHELNNPAAAVKRGATQLEAAMDQLAKLYVDVGKLDLTETQRRTWEVLTMQCQTSAAHPQDMDPLERSDREYEFETWLEDQGIEDAWEIAPILVDLNYSIGDLNGMAKNFDGDQLGILVRWLCSNYSVYRLFSELQQGAERISGIVKALKTYSYLDQAPVQSVNINRGLDDTLLILNHKLKTGINVRRAYADDLPEINGFGSELNQVWTNIIDNAADALAEASGDEPTITLRTRQEGDFVVVEIEDNGTGIPPEVQKRMFEPFFTTKPPGVGTGLGLDISYNIVVNKHRGDIKVHSKPGQTIFEVWLPINYEASVVTTQPHSRRQPAN